MTPRSANVENDPARDRDSLSQYLQQFHHHVAQLSDPHYPPSYGNNPKWHYSYGMPSSPPQLPMIVSQPAPQWMHPSVILAHDTPAHLSYDQLSKHAPGGPSEGIAHPHGTTKQGSTISALPPLPSYSASELEQIRPAQSDIQVQAPLFDSTIYSNSQTATAADVTSLPSKTPSLPTQSVIHVATEHQKFHSPQHTLQGQSNNSDSQLQYEHTAQLGQETLHSMAPTAQKENLHHILQLVLEKTSNADVEYPVKADTWTTSPANTGVVKDSNNSSLSHTPQLLATENQQLVQQYSNAHRQIQHLNEQDPELHQTQYLQEENGKKNEHEIEIIADAKKNPLQQEHSHGSQKIGNNGKHVNHFNTASVQQQLFENSPLQQEKEQESSLQPIGTEKKRKMGTAQENLAENENNYTHHLQIDKDPSHPQLQENIGETNANNEPRYPPPSVQLQQEAQNLSLDNALDIKHEDVQSSTYKHPMSRNNFNSHLQNPAEQVSSQHHNESQLEKFPADADKLHSFWKLLNITATANKDLSTQNSHDDPSNQNITQANYSPSEHRKTKHHEDIMEPTINSANEMPHLPSATISNKHTENETTPILEKKNLGTQDTSLKDTPPAFSKPEGHHIQPKKDSAQEEYHLEFLNKQSTEPPTLQAVLISKNISESVGTIGESKAENFPVTFQAHDLPSRAYPSRVSLGNNTVSHDLPSQTYPSIQASMGNKTTNITTKKQESEFEQPIKIEAIQSTASKYNRGHFNLPTQHSLARKRVFTDNLPVNMSSAEYGFFKEPFSKSRQENEQENINFTTTSTAQKENQAFPIQYLKEHIKTKEPYEVITDSTTQTTEQISITTTDIPDYQIMKILESSSDSLIKKIEKHVEAMNEYVKNATQKRNERFKELINKVSKQSKDLSNAKTTPFPVTISTIVTTMAPPVTKRTLQNLPQTSTLLVDETPPPHIDEPASPIIDPAMAKAVADFYSDELAKSAPETESNQDEGVSSVSDSQDYEETREESPWESHQPLVNKVRPKINRNVFKKIPSGHSVFHKDVKTSGANKKELKTEINVSDLSIPQNSIDEEKPDMKRVPEYAKPGEINDKLLTFKKPLYNINKAKEQFNNNMKKVKESFLNRSKTKSNKPSQVSQSQGSDKSTENQSNHAEPLYQSANDKQWLESLAVQPQAFTVPPKKLPADIITHIQIPKSDGSDTLHNLKHQEAPHRRSCACMGHTEDLEHNVLTDEPATKSKNQMPGCACSQLQKANPQQHSLSFEDSIGSSSFEEVGESRKVHNNCAACNHCSQEDNLNMEVAKQPEQSKYDLINKVIIWAKHYLPKE